MLHDLLHPCEGIKEAVRRKVMEDARMLVGPRVTRMLRSGMLSCTSICLCTAGMLPLCVMLLGAQLAAMQHGA